MHDREDGVAVIEQRLGESLIDRFVAREPAAADDKDDSLAVGLGGAEDVERKRRAELAGVDHVFGALHRRRVVGANERRCEQQG